MTLAEIIPLAYRGCPPIEAHDAIREAMEAEGRRMVAKRAPQGGGRRAHNGQGQMRFARAKRDEIRAEVWTHREAGKGLKAIGRIMGKSPQTIARILREGREPAECRRAA